VLFTHPVRSIDRHPNADSLFVEKIDLGEAGAARFINFKELLLI
jgi:tRNA-binding EMAP/Myf-like protein